MTRFPVRPAVFQRDTCWAFAADFRLGPQDLILTHETLYATHFAPLDLSCPVLFQEHASDPAKAEIPPTVERIVAVGGVSVMDLAQRLAQDKELLLLPTTRAAQKQQANVIVLIPELLQTRSFADFAVTSLDVLRSCLGLEAHHPSTSV